MQIVLVQLDVMLGLRNLSRRCRSLLLELLSCGQGDLVLLQLEPRAAQVRGIGSAFLL